ncbi:hypothetical protein [Mitsuaria sp. GD03876]|uniref:hypothetical protein n=1 Tax=Mitsuaria sp. GD03876 TaxID=2975399 RepID=UPI002448A6FB|nr:hypothetical protein [Mitsuaria sp. GD03876]MDH0866107.1 hypothetical protein [Mitsuaria sp. GD03876]
MFHLNANASGLPDDNLIEQYDYVEVPPDRDMTAGRAAMSPWFLALDWCREAQPRPRRFGPDHKGDTEFIAVCRAAMALASPDPDKEMELAAKAYGAVGTYIERHRGERKRRLHLERAETIREAVEALFQERAEQRSRSNSNSGDGARRDSSGGSGGVVHLSETSGEWALDFDQAMWNMSERSSAASGPRSTPRSSPRASLSLVSSCQSSRSSSQVTSYPQLTPESRATDRAGRLDEGLEAEWRQALEGQDLASLHGRARELDGRPKDASATEAARALLAEASQLREQAQADLDALDDTAENELRAVTARFNALQHVIEFASQY